MREYDDFELAFDRLLGLAYRHARRLVGDTGLAEDLAAVALARTLVRWPPNVGEEIDSQGFTIRVGESTPFDLVVLVVLAT
jgi:hypothetical protein